MKHDENIALAEEFSAIIQMNLPQKLTDLVRFTIPCSIGSLSINHVLCDLGVGISLMPLSMMRKLKCGEPKPTHMTLTLVDGSIMYPYGVSEDVLVRVDVLLYPVDFVFFDMHEDSKRPLQVGSPFLAKHKAFINVAQGDLVLIFNEEKFVFYVFEALKHHKENP